jgi:probable addiction module antidote protein
MNKEIFSRYDSADYLKTEEDAAAYLEAVAEENCDDPTILVHALGVVARARNTIRKAKSTQ